MKPRFEVGLELRRAGGGRGDGVFVTESVSSGRRILTFGGPRLTRRQYERIEDFEHCLQIGVDDFLGPSGGLDDYANHSCDPSTRVAIEGPLGRAHLFARRDLRPGDEVTFDYTSVQLDDSRFRMEPCRCGAGICRGVIGDFSQLRLREKAGLFERGLCAPWVAAAFLEECARRGLTLPESPRT